MKGPLHSSSPRYERELAAGGLASALVTIIKGTGDLSVVRSLPRFLSVPLFHLAIAADAQDAKADHVPLKELIPTMRFDAQLVAEAERAQEALHAIRADLLVLGGSKSAPYLRDCVDALLRRLPNAKRVRLPGVGHLAAENGGRPELVAEALRAFLAGPVIGEAT